jgi:glycosyltransferase involved in cell wall biosynthesis
LACPEAVVEPAHGEAEYDVDLHGTPGRVSLTASICLGTWNGEAYLEQLLESIAGQVRLPDELVVGDDGSTDSTVAIVKRFAARSGFRVLVQENPERLGVDGNFQHLIGRATGDVIFPCDQDDVWLPEKLSMMLAELEQRPEVVGLFCNSFLIDASGRRLPGTLWSITHSNAADRAALKSGRGLVQLVARPSVAGHALAFRSGARDLVLPFSPSCLYDMWISRLLAATGGLASIEETLVEYRLHDANALGLAGVSRSALSPASWNAPNRWAQDVVAMDDMIVRLHERAPGSLRGDDEAVLRERTMHLDRRTQLPARRLRRIGPVSAEILSGRYSRYSNGLRSAGRDLMQRSGPPAGTSVAAQ